MGIFDFLNKKDAKQKPTGKVIRHIVCLCYDAPYINSLKPQIQDFIIKAEQERGNHLFTRPCSRCCARHGKQIGAIKNKRQQQCDYNSVTEVRL